MTCPAQAVAPVTGVVLAGIFGANAGSASASALPALRHELTAAGVPPVQQRLITGEFRACFSARAHAKDPSVEPAACAAGARELAASPAPAAVKARVEAAVLGRALPAARLDDFVRSMRTALCWHLAAFAIALLLSARLPRVRLDEDEPVVGGA